jgi:tRNA-dihydrouridine synthase
LLRCGSNASTNSPNWLISNNDIFKRANAEELIACADNDGGLIGGASLKSEDFLSICKAG